MTAGGPRRGAGRKKLPPGQKRVGHEIKMTPSHWERVDRVARSNNRSRAKLIEALVDHAIPEKKGGA